MFESSLIPLSTKNKLLEDCYNDPIICPSNMHKIAFTFLFNQDRKYSTTSLEKSIRHVPN